MAKDTTTRSQPAGPRPMTTREVIESHGFAYPSDESIANARAAHERAKAVAPAATAARAAVVLDLYERAEGSAA